MSRLGRYNIKEYNYVLGFAAINRRVTSSVFDVEDEIAQSVECWPSDRETRVQLPAEESHSS